MITLTELAARKVQQQLDRRGKGVGIAIGVKTTGCSGLACTSEYVDQAPVTRDWMGYDSHGVKIYVNGRDLVYLDGLEMDWKRQGLNEGFDFINPRETARCGCGESFKV